MQREVNLLDYLLPLIAQTDEFAAIGAAENEQINDLWTAHKNVYNNQFIATLDETGCQRWEKILEITPMGTDTIEDRRFRIAARINADIPYTYKQLQNMLASLCDDDYTMELQNEDYKLIVRVALSAQRQYSEVEKLLKRVLPANLVLDLSLLYNQYQALTSKTHAQLNAYTHQQLRTEVISNG